MNFATLDLNLLRVLDAILCEGSTTKAGGLPSSNPQLSLTCGLGWPRITRTLPLLKCVKKSPDKQTDFWQTLSSGFPER